MKLLTCAFTSGSVKTQLRCVIVITFSDMLLLIVDILHCSVDQVVRMAVPGNPLILSNYCYAYLQI